MKSKHPFIYTAFPPAWSEMKPECLNSDIDKAIRTANKNLDKIRNLTEDKISYESCIRAFDRACADLDNAWTAANHLDSVSNSPELRKAISEVLPKVTDFYAGIYLDDRLWNVIRKFSESEEAKSLDGYKKRLLEEAVDDFKTSGADLPKEKKARYRQIESQLAQKTQKFSENVLDAIAAYEKRISDANELAGLPESAVALAKKKAQKKDFDGWIFTLEQPSITPVMTYAESDKFRREMWEASAGVGVKEPYSNLGLISEILSLRDESSKILGYENFADSVLFRRMAANGAKALKFIEDLHSKMEDSFKKETDSLESFKAECTSSAKEHLQPWEISYWAERQFKSKYNFTLEQLRDYFSFNDVLNGLFSLCNKLYGIDVKKVSTPDVWDESVEFFEVRSERGKLIGAFYADFFPRPTKRGGAWMNLLRPAKGLSPALGFIGGNLNEPANGRPALLSFDEVCTLFHEFGHLVHFFMMDCPEVGLRDVAWDFVELPSQIMENWCFKRECLDTFARHYKTGELIPDSLFEPFLKSRKFRGATQCMRQLSFAYSDLLLHIKPAEFLPNPVEKVDKMLDAWRIPTSTPGASILPRFTHIFGEPVGYAAGYYSYKWAEVLDADAFSKFERNGIFDSKTGREFANKILRVGMTVSPEEAFENFMGRPPSMEALIKRTIDE